MQRLMAALVLTLVAGIAAAECGPAQREVWSGPARAGRVAEGWPMGPRDGMPWGAGTATIRAGNAGPVLAVRFPEGSINPGNPDAPEGGIGLRLRFPPPAFVEGCLGYELQFEAGFDFGLGGKLPGLFGGRRNTGCAPMTDLGFSTRHSWGRRGNASLYAYLAERTTRCGTGMGGGRVFFEPGRWYRIAQYLRLNRPGHADGAITIWIDGEEIAAFDGLEIRASADQRIEGVMIESFFGGSSPDRASPADQSLLLRRFSFHVR